MTPDSWTLLDAYLTSCRSRGHSEATLLLRRQTITRFAEQVAGDLRSATLAQLEEWTAQPGWAAASRVAFVCALRAFYSYAHEAGHLETNPAARLRRPRSPVDVPNPCTEQELADVLARAGEPIHTAMLLAAYAGLRCADIVGLRREDITQESIRIARGKGQRAASIPTHKRIWDHRKDRPPGLIVTNEAGLPLAPELLSRRAGRRFARIGMPDMHLHRGRHYFATALLRGGANIRTVQTLMRHTSIATTARYLQVTDAELRAAVGGL
jgi:site-specific recombinase XerD